MNFSLKHFSKTDFVFLHDVLSRYYAEVLSVLRYHSMFESTFVLDTYLQAWLSPWFILQRSTVGPSKSNKVLFVSFALAEPCARPFQNKCSSRRYVIDVLDTVQSYTFLFKKHSVYFCRWLDHHSFKTMDPK